MKQEAIRPSVGPIVQLIMAAAYHPITVAEPWAIACSSGGGGGNNVGAIAQTSLAKKEARAVHSISAVIPSRALHYYTYAPIA